MTQSASSVGIEQVIELLKLNFIAPDNIPEDTARRDQICMEARASLLIEANCTSERFPAFMKSGRRTSSGWVYRFPHPFVRKLPHFFRGRTVTLTWTFSEFEIGYEQSLIDIQGELVDRWRLSTADYSNKENLRQHAIDQNNWPASETDDELRDDFKQIEQDFQQTYCSRFQLCSQISPYKTPEQVCRFFGNRGEVFAKLKSGGMRPDCFPEAIKFRITGDQDLQHCAEEQLIQVYLQKLYPCSVLTKEFPIIPYKHYDDGFCQVFRFKDQYGEIRMLLIKLYEPKTQTKCLIPATSWMRGNFPYNQLFCVPLPEDKQPLYNLDLLLKPETEIVILTDSIEIADSNQRNAPDGVVFTSFICSIGRYEQVDWSPLREKEVWYLVTNHSGIRLEAAYLKTQKLADFLLETEEICLKYIQLKVEYPVVHHFESVDTLLNCYRTRKPEVNPESLLLLENGADFDVQYNKAVAEYVGSSQTAGNSRSTS